MQKGIGSDHPGVEGGIVVFQERVVLGEDVVGARVVEFGHQGQPDGHGVHAVMRVHAGNQVWKQRK